MTKLFYLAFWGTESCLIPCIQIVTTSPLTPDTLGGEAKVWTSICSEILVEILCWAKSILSSLKLTQKCKVLLLQFISLPRALSHQVVCGQNPMCLSRLKWKSLPPKMPGHIFFNPYWGYVFINFGDREREREKHQPVASRIHSDLRPNTHPGRVPWLGLSGRPFSTQDDAHPAESY